MTLEELVAAHLDADAADITDATGSATSAEWSSLTYIEIITSVEAAYGISFSSQEIQTITDVGGLRSALRVRGVA